MNFHFNNNNSKQLTLLSSLTKNSNNFSLLFDIVLALTF